MSPTMNSTVSVERVVKTYGSTIALDGIDLEIGRGITGLLGPNGAGKTSLLRIVATVLAPDAGGVRVLGHDVGTADGRLAVRRRLGYVPQEAGLHPTFTPFEFVDYVAILKEMTDRRARHDDVRRVLETVGLTSVMHKKIRKLSGGMRRRVALAQALLGHPELLVLDEPTAGLDPEQRLRFRETVSNAAEKHTVLLATHLTEDVSALCSRVVVVDGGAIRFDGTPADLRASARGSVWTAPQASPSAHVSWRTAEGVYRCLGGAAPAGATLVEPTLEDAYLLLVGERALDDEMAA